ncbi:nucleotide disphospho-sugar-binding domain-containing protein [Streptomyces sp. NPDC050388]|uniref:nucleotide disphospho-sugar-binding domain-containing protein n=1 Tax=Streptomyces sp. NPDC050388 TaxID=3155781 RepID=UPI0034370F11
MRVAFVMWPAAAHLYPFVPLAWALKAAGHEVCVVSHASIAETTASMGLTPVSWCDPNSMPVPMGPGRPYPEERADLARITDAMAFGPDDPDREHWDVFTQFYLPSMWDFIPFKGDPGEPMPAMDGLVEFTRTWKPDLVLWDPCVPGAAVAARVCGVAQARWWTAPDVFCRSIDRFAEVTGRPGAPAVENPLVETVRPMADRYGVEVDTELLFGQWTVNPQPPAVGPAVSARTMPVRWIPHSSQEVMPDWVYPVPARPRVAVSLGLSERQFMAGGWNHIPALLEALSTLDVEVVATLNKTQLEAVSTIPDNVRVVEFVPLNHLIPTCSLLIHHGGMGTAMPAVANCVPQIVLDFVGHEISATGSGGRMGRSRYSLGPALSRYVTETGAGLVMNVSKPNAQEMREQIQRVLTEPSFQEGAARVHNDLLATPSPAEFVPILERMVTQYRQQESTSH